MALTFIDLGLPSGTLWATENAAVNEKTYFNFDEAVEAFGDMLPSAEAWRELFDHCSRKWDGDRQGYILTGPNSKTLFLPAEGYQDWDIKTKELNGRSDYVGILGYYWSSSPSSTYNARHVGFDKRYFNPHDYDNRMDGFSVRLCKPAGAQ